MKTLLEDYLNNHSFEITREVCEPYATIWAWGKICGSMDYYIASMVKKAIEDKAPLNAIFYDDIYECWHTLDNTHPITKSRVNEYLKK